ncbi:MAG TPA: PAS domain S-box protein [Candidatus Omnitrophota bacterium]|nr:PAS domain S-box protein [Candidatus Omnitrophota bacterium]
MNREEENGNELFGKEDLLQKRIAELEAENIKLKKDEEQNRRTLTHLDFLTRYANDIIILLDENFNFIEVNERVVDVYGYTRQELIGMNAIRLRAPEARTSFKEQTAIAPSGRNLFETIHQHKNGRQFPVEISLRVFESGGKKYYQAIIRDISERKKIEKALRESELKYRTLFETAREAIVILKEGRCVDCNTGALEMYGYSSKDVVGTDIFKFAPPVQPDGRDSREKGLDLIRKAIAGEPQFFEWENIRGNGTQFTAEINMTRVEIEGETLVLAVARDIAERKRTEAILRQSEERLRSILWNVPVGVCIAKDRVFVSANKCWCDMFGYPEDAIRGRKTRMMYENDEEHERVGRELYADLRGKGKKSVETRHMRKDGSMRNVVVSVVPLSTSDLPGGETLSIVTDITERKQYEAELEKYRKHLEDMVRIRTSELRESNEQLGAIFEAATSGIVLVRDRIVVRCNRRMDEIFGYAPGEMVGHTTRQWYGDENSYREIGEETFYCITHDRTFFREQKLVRKDGSFFWGRMTGRAMDKSDPSKGLVGLIEDITEEKEAAESLKTALARAESADRMKSAFLATMSHELRTPLNSIIGFTGMLLQGLAGPLNDEQATQLRMVKDSGRHLRALINDVLDISKIEAGELEIAPEKFDLRECVQTVIQTVSPLAGKKQILLNSNISPDIGAVVSDQQRVAQILLNLLSNAVKFTDQGEVALTVELAGDQVIISVSDTGIGIKNEDLDKLFKPFRQIDTGLTRQYEGTGLGLAICKRLVEKLGGNITVKSEWGKGSKFQFTLPYCSERRI